MRIFSLLWGAIPPEEFAFRLCRGDFACKQEFLSELIRLSENLPEKIAETLLLLSPGRFACFQERTLECLSATTAFGRLASHKAIENLEAALSEGAPPAAAAGISGLLAGHYFLADRTSELTSLFVNPKADRSAALRAVSGLMEECLGKLELKGYQHKVQAVFDAMVPLVHDRGYPRRSEVLLFLVAQAPYMDHEQLRLYKEWLTAVSKSPKLGALTQMIAQRALERVPVLLPKILFGTGEVPGFEFRRVRARSSPAGVLHQKKMLPLIQK